MIKVDLGSSIKDVHAEKGGKGLTKMDKMWTWGGVFKVHKTNCTIILTLVTVYSTNLCSAKNRENESEALAQDA